MGSAVLILGESGSGKSTSMRNLPPEETVLINIEGKPLPFKGWKKKFSKERNLVNTDRTAKILKALDHINKDEKIKYVIIDDMQYIMANEYMRRAKEPGWEKFQDIGQNIFLILEAATSMRDDMFVFLMSHIEHDEHGRIKAKTIGKMIDEKIVIEGMFSMVLMCEVVDGEHKFRTKTNGMDRVKTPFQMFDDTYIDNDIMEVVKAVKAFDEEEI